MKNTAKALSYDTILYLQPLENNFIYGWNCGEEIKLSEHNPPVIIYLHRKKRLEHFLNDSDTNKEMSHFST